MLNCLKTLQFVLCLEMLRESKISLQGQSYYYGRKLGGRYAKSENNVDQAQVPIVKNNSQQEQVPVVKLIMLRYKDDMEEISYKKCYKKTEDLQSGCAGGDIWQQLLLLLNAATATTRLLLLLSLVVALQY